MVCIAALTRQISYFNQPAMIDHSRRQLSGWGWDSPRFSLTGPGSVEGMGYTYQVPKLSHTLQDTHSPKREGARPDFSGS